MKSGQGRDPIGGYDLTHPVYRSRRQRSLLKRATSPGSGVVVASLASRQARTRVSRVVTKRRAGRSSPKCAILARRSYRSGSPRAHPIWQSHIPVETLFIAEFQLFALWTLFQVNVEESAASASPHEQRTLFFACPVFGSIMFSQLVQAVAAQEARIFLPVPVERGERRGVVAAVCPLALPHVERPG